MKNIKELLGLCGTKFHFGRSVATVEITGIKHSGERVLVKEQNLCKRCLYKAVNASVNEVDEIHLEFEDGSKISFETGGEDES